MRTLTKAEINVIAAKNLGFTFIAGWFDDNNGEQITILLTPENNFGVERRGNGVTEWDVFSTLADATTFAENAKVGA